MANLTAYLDESADDKVYAISGFVSSNEVWNSFTSAWQAELNATPKISHFKIHDVFTTKSNGVFRNTPTATRITKTEALISILNAHLPTSNDFAVSVVMDYRAYKSMLQPVVPDNYKNPYIWCFQGILVMCSSLINLLLPQEKIDVIFDDNKKEFRDALAVYRGLAGLPGFVKADSILDNVQPGDDKTIVPLQAADLLVGQTRAYATHDPSAIFIPLITRTDRRHNSYRIGKKELHAIRSRFEATTAWLIHSSRS